MPQTTQLADVTRRLATVLGELSPERLIAVARLLLALFAILAIWLDPTQPALDPAIAYALLAAYLAYAAALVGGAFLVDLDFRAALATHVVDIAAFVALMHFTEGPTSPFFVLFTFALFSATLRWNWQGALITAAALVVLFVAIELAATATPDDEWATARTVTRGGYLIVAGAILAYLGFLRERARQRVARLADWPAEATCDAEMPPLEKTLSHAAAVMGARRVLVAWEIDEEPYLHLAWHDDTGFSFERRPPPEAPLVAEALADTPLLVTDAATGRYRVRGFAAARRNGPLDPALVAEFAVTQAAVAPLRNPRLSGHVLLLDIERPGEDLLALAEIVASHIAGQIEHHMLHQELADAAAARERMRLARDVHDGTLQALTALQLRLAELEGKAAKRLGPRIRELRQLIDTQNERLRDFVRAIRPRNAAPVELKPPIGRVLSEIGAQWRCLTALKVEPPDLHVPAGVATAMSLMIMEAAANGARHGGATRVEISIARRDNRLRLEIRDNGTGLRSSPNGGPHSLRQRVADLGGIVSLTKHGQGTTVTIELPV